MRQDHDICQKQIKYYKQIHLYRWKFHFSKGGYTCTVVYIVNSYWRIENVSQIFTSFENLKLQCKTSMVNILTKTQ